MMEKKSKEIVEALTKTNEFKALKQAMIDLDKNKQSKMSIEQFSKDHTEVCSQPDGGEKHQKENLERRFDKMMQVPEIAAYIRAGQKFDVVLTELHHRIDMLVDEALEERN
jgi:cell fate (sporulation/competence/biofilm development) regulator YlbF (YheA/YmcA/DUF963 family)